MGRCTPEKSTVLYTDGETIHYYRCSVCDSQRFGLHKHPWLVSSEIKAKVERRKAQLWMLLEKNGMNKDMFMEIYKYYKANL